MRSDAAYLLGLMACCTFIPSARASTAYITDTFSGTDGTVLQGRLPDAVDLPGSLYVTSPSAAPGTPVLGTSPGNAAHAADLMNNGAAALRFATNPNTGWTKPAQFTIAGDLMLNDIAGSGVNGVGLGFFSSLPGTVHDANIGFTGLTLASPAAGNATLQLLVNGVATGTPVPVLVGTFAPSRYYTLAYTVDSTGGGTISNIIFNGTDVSSAFAAATGFTSTATTLTGFYARTDPSIGSGTHGYVDNFALSSPTVAAPEPTTPSLGILLTGGLLRRRRRGR